MEDKNKEASNNLYSSSFPCLFSLRRNACTAMDSVLRRIYALNVRHICEGTASENHQQNMCTKVDSNTTAQLL
ncbi:MAG TPA: hypothetical protein PKV73_11620, partial [Agriterribacter sp.]|nr:hypothetical protein [Agriterribacter sp.]